MHHDDYNAHQMFSSFRARRLTRNDEFIPIMRQRLSEVKEQHRDQFQQRLFVATFTVLLLGAVLAIGHMALNDAKLQQQQYCQMVQQGLWPDFHHSYKTECNGLRVWSPILPIPSTATTQNALSNPNVQP